MTEGKTPVKILKPKLPYTLPRFDFSVEGISEYSSIAQIYLKDECLENINAEHVSFNEVLFKNVKFKNVSLCHIELVDVRFENCDLSNVIFREASIHRAEFINCKLTGINLNEATIKNVVFDECIGQYANKLYSIIASFAVLIFRRASF